jgi:hypothetical protein
LLLTKEESVKLAEALSTSGAPSLSFIALESIEAGLRKRNPNGIQTRRTHTFPLWVPEDVMEEVRRLAVEWDASQQSIIRHFLLTYLASPPWKHPKKRLGQSERRGSSKRRLRS